MKAKKKKNPSSCEINFHIQLTEFHLLKFMPTIKYDIHLYDEFMQTIKYDIG